MCGTTVGEIGEEVMEKFQMEVSKRGVYKERGEPSEWRYFQSQKNQPREWVEDCWARTFSWFGAYYLQLKNGMQESQTEKEDMRQQ